MEDANDFSWDVARASHAVLFVGWSKERSKVIVRLISWIESVELMLKDT